MAVDIGQVEAAWRTRGFSFGVWVDPPGQRWEGYVHEVNELVMVVEGEVEFEVGGEIHRPEAGEELFIPAGVVHAVRNVGATTSRWLYGYHHG